MTDNSPYRSLITQYVVNETDMAEGWIAPHEKEDADNQDEYPKSGYPSGGQLIIEWTHQERDENIELWAAPENNVSFGVNLGSDGALYHGHGTSNIERAIEAASMASYLLNHNSHSMKRQQKEDLNSKVENLQEQLEAEKKRNRELRNKNETLRSQLGTFIETASSGYTDGNYSNTLRPQHWRPPYKTEVNRLKIHIKKYWYGDTDTIQDTDKEQVKKDIENSYIIVLDNFSPITKKVQNKVMFVMSLSEQLYSAFLFKSNSDELMMVRQAEDMWSGYSDDNVVVSFQNTD